MRKEIPSGLTPIDAIADAMMRSYWFQMVKEFNLVGIDKNKPELNGTLTDFFESATAGNCYLSSTDTVAILMLRNRELFKSLFLITSEVISRRSQFADCSYHTYLVAEDNEGNWYAASPANHNVMRRLDYATTIIQEKDLDSVLEKITDRDAATFPNSRSVFQLLKKNSYSLPFKKGDNLKILELTKIPGKVDSIFENKYLPIELINS